jgi:hypothetical protein
MNEFQKVAQQISGNINECAFANVTSGQTVGEIAEISEYFKTDKEVVTLLQQNIPTILENETYFDAYAARIEKVYHFVADKDHLRKKLNLFLQDTLRGDDLHFAQRLVRGKFTVVCNEQWLWLDGKIVACLSQGLFADTKKSRA